jgi:NAD(P)-dependent dehydrogenase (short-subunit alcohol dehydrogenase family)
MNKKTILILGGYGGVGKSLCNLLLLETDVNLIVAGRSEAKAEEFARILNQKHEGNRASARYADQYN